MGGQALHMPPWLLGCEAELAGARPLWPAGIQQRFKLGNIASARTG